MQDSEHPAHAAAPVVARGVLILTRIAAAAAAVVLVELVEEEVHLPLHAEDLARLGLADLLVADAPPAVWRLALPVRPRRRRHGHGRRAVDGRRCAGDGDGPATAAAAAVA
ncbi:hypothetical protein HYQ45_018972 [Verticillium longisporum]|uniref:Uncharacterized protein n=1 Tax=Verticillium longisporum TaxID=100787 RepID=A0A8I3AK62_VERLO|nr:hypothetical protein HYQ45_018972 [Verticillium longisporum]